MAASNDHALLNACFFAGFPLERKDARDGLTFLDEGWQAEMMASSTAKPQGIAAERTRRFLSRQ
jgi:hypothetical protein